MDDPLSPFYINPSDDPDVIFVSPILTGTNYNQWRKAMCKVLAAKNKLGFVDGSIEPSAWTNEEEICYHAWGENDKLVARWLRNSMSDEVAVSASLSYSSCTARGIWKDLEERFQRLNGPRIFELKKELTSCTQGHQSLAHYFKNFNTLFQELAQLFPINNCKCGAAQPLLDHLHKEYVITFLIGLDNSFDQARSIILLKDPIPSIKQVFSILLQEEKNIRAIKNAQRRKAIDNSPSQSQRQKGILGSPSHPIDIVESPPQSHSPPQMDIVESVPPSTIIVNIISFMKPKFPLQMESNDTILKVKEMIRDKGKAMEVERITLLNARGRELHDNQVVKDCHITDIADNRSYIYMYERSASVDEEQNMLTLTMITKNGEKIMGLEVNPLAKVSDLKKELQKSNLPDNVIPAHGHFCFTYNQCLMYESMPFQWHGVDHGDTIEISGY